MHLSALFLVSAVAAAAAPLVDEAQPAIGIIESDAAAIAKPVQARGPMRQMAGSPAEGSYLKKRQAAALERARKEQEEQFEMLRLQLAAQQATTTTDTTTTDTTTTDTTTTGTATTLPTSTDGTLTTTTTALTTTTHSGSATLTVTSTSNTSVTTNTTSITSSTATIVNTTRTSGELPRKVPCNDSSKAVAGQVVFALLAASLFLMF